VPHGPWVAATEREGEVNMPVARRDRIATTPPMEWTGWWRPRDGGQWQPLCNGSTYDEVWWELYREMDTGRTGDWMVLRIGQRP